MTTTTATTETATTTSIEERIAADLADVDVPALTLGDLIRAGSAHTTKEEDWGSGDRACALSAGAIAAKSLGLITDDAR